ncbi:hypothetical protein Tco_0768626 [Tanacetum coccineum]
MIPSYLHSSNHSSNLEMGLSFVLSRTLVVLFCSVDTAYWCDPIWRIKLASASTIVEIDLTWSLGSVEAQISLIKLEFFSFLFVDSPINFLRFSSIDCLRSWNQPDSTSDELVTAEMAKLDKIILASKVKNNREANEYYLKHTMKQAAILWELIQELLGYVRDTCPDIHKPSEKLVAVMPINKKKTVLFTDTVTSSGNIPKVTNRPVFSSTGVNPSY